MDDFSLKIEALLFALGEPLSRKELAKMVGADASAIESALTELRENRKGGIVLVDDGSVVELRAAPEAAELIEKIRKEEYSRDIGRAGLEVLAAVLYRGSLTRSQIDFIRGVNSSQTVRTLTMRGLLRKVPNPKDERSFLYEATTELMSHIGVAHASDLPEYGVLREKLQKLEDAQKQITSEEASA